MKRLILLIASLSFMSIGFSQEQTMIAANTFSDDTYYLEEPATFVTDKTVKTESAEKETAMVFTNYALINFPGPATQVNITLTNSNKEVVYQSTVQTLADDKSVQFNIYDLPKGHYTYVLIDEQNGKPYMATFRKN